MDISNAIQDCLQKRRGLKLDLDIKAAPLETLAHISSVLRQSQHVVEAEALQRAWSKCSETKELGGLGYGKATGLTESQLNEVLFQVDAFLKAVNSREGARILRNPMKAKFPQTRPMTMAQKIFAHHAVDICPVEGLHLRDVTRVAVDWIMASELSYRGIEKTIEEVGDPGIFRNDRFWLAGDHVYDPRIAHVPRVQALYESAEKAKKKYKMTEYQGMNYTIMHTEFVRERAQPGMLVIGADSHTCSAGAVGCLAIGLGAIDVAMALITGETWFKIPESILINFTGKPAFGISGKDVILHILKVLKRNTVAAERIVEFAGSGLEWLSVDARFAISNMCTEFGAVTGVFCPDKITHEYISSRPLKANKSESTYFRPDEGAQYADVFEINLSDVEPTIALYPNPDDVVPLSERPDLKFDGVFIGACTTTEEELILAGLILKAGLAKNIPLVPGMRRVVPGSLPITEKLRKLGLLEVYEAAGFTVGLPGCSYCVGMAADQAGEGEVWLSSQNRNFRNRMGKGSIGNVTSAAVVAASSFSMRLTNPTELITEIDQKTYHAYTIGTASPHSDEVEYVEPRVAESAAEEKTNSQEESREIQNGYTNVDPISSRVITLEDYIDTDALAPAMVLSTAKTDEEFGQHCLEHTHPDFRQKVHDGQQIVVAGKAFGVGSSREEAVRALKGLGVKAVIAKSYAFIYGRNQASWGLLGVTVEDDAFYEAATDGVFLKIDISSRTVSIGEGSDVQKFPFIMSDMEYRLTMNNGINAAYGKFKNELWKHMIGNTSSQRDERSETEAALEANLSEKQGDKRMQW